MERSTAPSWSHLWRVVNLVSEVNVEIESMGFGEVSYFVVPGAEGLSTEDVEVVNGDVMVTTRRVSLSMISPQERKWCGGRSSEVGASGHRYK